MRIVVETDVTISGWEMPDEGQVWLCLETGMLYEMRKWKNGPGPRDTGHCSPHRTAHRVGAPESGYGCDPSVFCAVFEDDVRNGRWVRILNCPELPKAPARYPADRWGNCRECGSKSHDGAC